MEKLSDRAVYLGDGVWWQLSEQQRLTGVGRGLPERIRPVRYPRIMPPKL